MIKYQIIFTDGSVKTLPAIAYSIHSGFLFFYGPFGVEAFATSTVKSFSQLPPGAA